MIPVERLRQGLYAAAFLCAGGTAWMAGGTLFAPPPSPEDADLVGRPVAAAPAASAARREDRTLESFRAVTSRRLVPPAPSSGAGLGPPPFKLLGTSYDPKDPRASKAMVQDSRGGIRSYKVGETVAADQARLLAVLQRRARFLWGGREVELGPEGAPVNPVVVGGKPADAALPGQTEFRISEQDWKAHYANLADLWNQVSIEAHAVNGRKEGMRIVRMDERFPGWKYGLKVNDVVKKVNGVALDSPMAMAPLLESLRKPQTLKIELERAGAPVTLNLQIGDKPAP